MGSVNRGGKREGSGRKRSENKKIRVSYSLAPDVVAYLNSRTDKPKAQVIEDAIRFFKEMSEIVQNGPITCRSSDWIESNYLLHNKIDI